MALDTIVRTVLLHDGPFDETDRFLLRAPATDYIENLHFHKRGNLQKRAGNALLSTVPNANGDPFFVQSIGNSLHTLTEDGARSFVNGAWREVDAVGFVGTKDMVVETPPVGGMGHVDFVRMGTDADSDALEHVVVVHEVRERSTKADPWGFYVETPKHIVVQNYDSDGNFVSQHRIENARSPKVVRHADQLLRNIFTKIFYVRDSDSHLVSQVFNPGTDTLSPSVVDTGLAVSKEYGMLSHAARQGAVLGFLFGGYMHTRLGASQDGHARYHIAPDTVGEQYYVLFQQDSTHDLYTGTIAANGTGAAQYLVALATSDESYEAFDVAWDFTRADSAYLLWAQYSADGVATPTSRVWVSRVDFSGGASIDWSTDVYVTQESAVVDGKKERLNPSQFTHGGLAVSNTVAWMAHDSGPCVGIAGDWNQDRFENTRHWNQGLRYGTVDSSGAEVVSAKTVPAQRLATRPYWSSGKLYAGVQQHIDHSIKSNANTQEGYSGILGALVPHTTSVLCFGDDGDDSPRIVGYVDAGQGKVTEYAESEFATHVPKIDLWENDILLINRVVIRAEDISESFWDTGTPGQPGEWYRGGSAESPADALCRIHVLRKGNADGGQIYAAKLGDGAIVSTAVPLWFDGKFFGEIGPIDQPEIIGLRDERMMTNSLATSRPPQNYKVGDWGDATRWRKLQVIVGYYDSKGNKHRSAPSSVLYVQGFHPLDANPVNFAGSNIPEKWNGKSTRIYYTPPLSAIPADLEYFVEVYASDSPDTHPQLVDVSTVRIDELNQLFYVEAQLVRYDGETGGTEFSLPPRTSPTIYTAGGELPAEPWPAFSRAVATSTRLMALDAVNKGKLLVSKRFQDFIAPEYNALLDINLGDERDLLCIGRMDDKTVIFEADDIHVVYGDGPENNGKGEDFAVQYISTDVGCKDQESIVECPLGLVFFREERGFYLLDRQLNIKYIGDKVHDLTQGIDVVASELVSKHGEVRFLCKVTGDQTDPDGLDPSFTKTRPPRPVYGNAAPAADFAMVWNYENDQWTVFNNYPGAASAIHQGRYTRLLSDWSIWQENEDTSLIYSDPTGDNRTLLRTTWIPLGDSPQGYGRLHRMNILGRYLASLRAVSAGVYEACDIQVKVWYDYEEGVDVTPQTKLFRYQDFGFDPFSKRDIRAERLQFTITPSEGRGRCQAVKLEFEEVVPAALPNGDTHALGQGFEISSIDFEIGVDSRVTRQLPAAVLK